MMSDSTRTPTAAPMSPLLLITSEFTLHREVFASVLRTLRPNLRIRLTEPDQADATVVQLEPYLVICETLSATIERLVPAWIVIPSDPALPACISGQGRKPQTIPNPSVEALVHLVDELLPSAALRSTLD